MKKIYALLMFLTLLVACSTPSSKKSEKFDLTEEEHACLEKFFRYFMLHETAIYTLAGSKPLTVMPLFYEDMTEEQLREDERNERVYFLLNRNNKKDMEFYNSLSFLEKEEKAYLIAEEDFIYPIEDLWDRWEKIQNRFPIKKKFLLVKKEWITDSWKSLFPRCKAIYDVFLVDILKTALIIQENYELFKHAVGYDFDPLEVVFELENTTSKFWDQLRGEEGWKYATLWGILYGFGRENAFSYTWKGRNTKEPNRTEQEKLWTVSLPSWSSCKTRPSPTDKGAFTLSNFTIPVFKSFSEKDPVVTKYEAERENIKRLYKGKDFVAYTLDLLTKNEKLQTMKN